MSIILLRSAGWARHTNPLTIVETGGELGEIILQEQSVVQSVEQSVEQCLEESVEMELELNI